MPTDFILVPNDFNWCDLLWFISEGEHVQTDTCCREHDHCPSTIPSFRHRFGILNYYPMHMSHCSCENRLYDCLWNVTSPVSVAVGRLYFNVFRPPCFQLVEVRACKKRSFSWKKFKFVCTEYGVQLKDIQGSKIPERIPSTTWYE